MHITLVAELLHVFEELVEGKGIVSTSIDGAVKQSPRHMVLVANVLSQVIFPKECLVAVFGTADDEGCFVSRWTSWRR